MPELIKTFPKEEFLELIANGMTEPEALKRFNFPRGTYVLLLVKDSEFKERLEDAKRARADLWFEGIAQSVGDRLEKEEVAAAKLKFEQRKYLAAIDNPDKYGERVKHQHDITVNLFQEMKDMSVAKARELMRGSDPFAVEAKAEVIPEVEYQDREEKYYDAPFEVTPEIRKAMMEPMEEVSDEELFK